MNELQVFNNREFGEIRTIEEHGKTLFCGSDVAKALGYTNPSKALGDNCKGITKRYTPTSGGKQETSFIPEGDVYRLIAHSKLPSAERFEKWVFEEGSFEGVDFRTKKSESTGGYVRNDELYISSYLSNAMESLTGKTSTRSFLTRFKRRAIELALV